jgi:hypothetical protein
MRNRYASKSVSSVDEVVVAAVVVVIAEGLIIPLLFFIRAPPRTRGLPAGRSIGPQRPELAEPAEADDDLRDEAAEDVVEDAALDEEDPRLMSALGAVEERPSLRQER